MIKFTGDVAKALVDMFESAMMRSTAALAGRYSDGRGKEDDIPY